MLHSDPELEPLAAACRDGLLRPAPAVTGCFTTAAGATNAFAWLARFSRRCCTLPPQSARQDAHPGAALGVRRRTPATTTAKSACTPRPPSNCCLRAGDRSLPPTLTGTIRCECPLTSRSESSADACLCGLFRGRRGQQYYILRCRFVVRVTSVDSAIAPDRRSAAAERVDSSSVM